MKSRVFVGSSIEGLSVAYAIHSNLTHDCEVTVWSQGAFELSKTTVESLMELLDNVDFAIFIFTQDDVLEIRENRTYTVRDNVLFEFGLFLGKLGRDRVFFIKPSDLEIHLPTDLLGMTPAKYESNRKDENLVAATGPACNDIRMLIKKHGPLQDAEEISSVPEAVVTKAENQTDWIDDLISGRYVDCIKKIDTLASKTTTRKELINFDYWKLLCQYRLDETKFDIFKTLIEKYPEDPYAHQSAAKLYWLEGFDDQAVEMLKEGLHKYGNSAEFIKLLANCHLKNGEKEQALMLFEDELTYKDPSAVIEYANIYIEDKNYEKAQEILHKAYQNFPKNILICRSYASVAVQLSEPEIALLMYDKLSKLEPNNYSNIGYIGNTCLSLNLNDIALDSYQKASEMENNSQSWIISNIGNLLKNRGFYRESIKYLRQALEIDEASDYALDRLAGAIKNKDEEIVKYNNFIKEGQKKLKEYSSIVT